MWRERIKSRLNRVFFPPSSLHRAPPPELAPARIQSWTTAELGDLDIATVRLIVPLPDGVALGSDYGLILHRNGQFQSFPWPDGSRRDARRIEAMAWHAPGLLYFGILRSLCTWNFSDSPQFRSHPPDQEDGWDELACLYSIGDRLLMGYRTKLVGMEGPADVLCATHNPESGVVYVGTRQGEVFALEPGQKPKCLQIYEDPGRGVPGMRRRPVRHMVWSQGRLWLSAAEQLHIFDGKTWISQSPEPTSLTVDPDDRVWGIRDGRLYRFDLVSGEVWPRLVAAPLVRPWSLCATAGGIWVGGASRVWHISFV